MAKYSPMPWAVAVTEYFATHLFNFAIYIISWPKLYKQDIDRDIGLACLPNICFSFDQFY